MSSKRKPNGCKSVECVKQAVQQCKSNLREFFALAAHAAGVQKTFVLERELELFDRLDKQGMSAVPSSYKIPQCILDLASTVLKRPHPVNYFRDLKNTRKFARPDASVQTYAPALAPA